MTSPITVKRKVQSGFTLVELVVTVAIAGILAGLGMAGMNEMVAAEKARNAAVKFATDLRRHRSEAAQRKMHTYVEMNNNGGSSTSVRFLAKRLGTDTSSPCELMQTGSADVVRSYSYEAINVALIETNPDTSAQARTNKMCFTQFGQPRSLDMTEMRALDLDLSSAGRSTLSMNFDVFGAMISSDSAASTGIAATGLHPQDLMAAESAPVAPGAFEEPAVTFYETDPGIFVEAGSAGGDGSTGINPCDPMYGMCPTECVMSLCAEPCAVCYNPCSDATYAATYPCECLGTTSCECDALYCACDPLVTTCPCTVFTIDTDLDGILDAC
jgi:prepilin-type N-terminal cleavage/methylation domain-containing protein